MHYGDGEKSQARLEAKTNHKDFCPHVSKDRFVKPSRCFPNQILYRTYFPKFEKPQVGKYKANFVDGLYFEHTFRALGSLCLLTGFSILFYVASLYFYIYWWHVKDDPVSGANIAAYWLGMSALLIGIGAFIPR